VGSYRVEMEVGVRGSEQKLNERKDPSLQVDLLYSKAVSWWVVFALASTYCELV